MLVGRVHSEYAMPPRLTRGGLRWAVVLAITIHAAAFLPLRAGSSRSGVVVASPSMQVRMLSAAPEQAHAPLPVPVSIPPAPPSIGGNPGEAQVARSITKVLSGPLAASTTAAEQLAANPLPPNPVASAVATRARGLPPAPDYLAAGQLDPGPTLLSEIEPEYPEAAGSLRGAVILRLLISDQGVVDDVSVVRAAPEGVFDAAAVAAFRAAIFSPGRVLGVPVKSQVTIEVAFTPLQRGDVSTRKY